PQDIDEAPTLKWDTAFRPILACSKLEELAIELSVNISDVDAQGIVSRFSGIKSLRLPGCLLSSPALGHFANLRHLCELEITTSAFERPTTQSDSLLSASRSSEAVLHLNVGASAVHSSSSAVDSIRKLFPHRRVINLTWSSGGEGEERDVYLQEMRELLRR
ncbi:hypothetical protein FRC07_013135, partial [Ceratobasidium sp. 392]